MLQLAFENTCRILLTQSGLYQLKQLKTKKERSQAEVGWGGAWSNKRNILFLFGVHLCSDFFKMSVTYISTVLSDDSDICAAHPKLRLVGILPHSLQVEGQSLQGDTRVQELI